MKSYINTLFDYRKAPVEWNVTVSCPKEEIQKQLRHLTRSQKKTVPAKVIENGDIVVLSLESEIEKFNKPTVIITVGGGLFDADFENDLIGHNVGEAFSVKVCEKAVKVTIKQANRIVFPEPTDENVVQYAKEHEEYSGISTVEQYRRYVIDKYINEQKQQILYQTIDEITEYVLTHSDWEFDEQELDELVKKEKAVIEQEFEEAESKNIESLSSEELKRYFEIESLEEFNKLLTEATEQDIAVALWLAEINGVDSKEKSIEELSALSWDFLENFVKENINIKEV